MAENTKPTADPFTSAMALSQMGVSSVPENYILPPSERPNLEQTPRCSFSALPVIDLASLENPLLRPQVIEQVHLACKEYGVFQVYSQSHIEKDMEQGSQVIAVNCYPACPEPNLALGLPRHSDYGLLTIILQNQQGLEVMDSSEKWQSVPVVKEALVVQVGDQMEVLSNGRYRSVVHRATVNSEKKRLSIASLHSLAMTSKVAAAPELVDELHPLAYKEGSFEDFLNFLANNDIQSSAPPPLLFRLRRT